MRNIPYGLHWIDESDIAAVAEALRGDWITGGPRVAEFERALASVAGARHAVAVSSGTAALEMAVQALDLPRGSEVITTPLTFAADANCIAFNGHTPVFADVVQDTRNIDPAAVRAAITDRTRALIYVDYAGHPCDIDALRALADEHDLYLIEDACHALGAEHRGRRVGSLADMTVFSFHPVKHVTTGEGGAITTEDDALDRRLRMLRNHGMDKEAAERAGSGADYWYDIKYLSRNFRITDFQCALGTSQLRRLEDFIRRRTELASMYTRAFEGSDVVEAPVTRPGVRHVWHIYTVLVREGVDRDAMFMHLKRSGIGPGVHYIPVYRHTYYRQNHPSDPADFPVTEDTFSRLLTLPLYPRMEDADVDRVVEAVGAYGGRS
jgi:UDP-4-amino-4,6-dideoxy-N-acetyl-beta-L-altrosamine transaminase